MYVRWQSRKRQSPDFGSWEAALQDKRGNTVYNERGTAVVTRKRADGSIAQDVRWSAIVVENVRVDGKPRQQHVAWLASITESASEIIPQRRYFWDAVHAGLDQLGNRLPVDDRRRIEAAIARKVPRLSRAEHDADIERSKAFFADNGWSSPGEYKPYRPPT